MEAAPIGGFLDARSGSVPPTAAFGEKLKKTPLIL
jgi:hypothetical protein